MTIRVRKFLISLFVLPAISYACEFDIDCDPGSKCAKPRGELLGICLGGLNPGNDNDRKPVIAPLDINGTYGNTCSFDIDCGPGSRCIKSNSSINGVCMKRK